MGLQGTGTNNGFSKRYISATTTGKQLQAGLDGQKKELQNTWMPKVFVDLIALLGLTPRGRPISSLKGKTNRALAHKEMTNSKI